MRTPRLPRLLVLASLLASAGCGTETSASPAGSAAPSTDLATHDDGHTHEADGEPAATGQSEPEMYNRRYCEVLGVTVDVATMTAYADVYNSLPFGTCPQAQWEALDASELAEQLGVSQVMLNGPRYFVVDRGSGSTLSEGSVETFGEITMMLLATVDLDLSGGMPSSESYALRQVVRDNAWFFDAGREVYELVDADGHTYIMQSYARIVDPDLDLADLPNLAEELTLPDGWTYQVRTLDEDLAVQADGIAVVVQDDLLNTYQLRQ